MENMLCLYLVLNGNLFFLICVSLYLVEFMFSIHYCVRFLFLCVFRFLAPTTRAYRDARAFIIDEVENLIKK